MLPDGRSVTLIDTVGLISRLPHQLVEAFKSTLEEAASADVIIHLMDASSDYSDEEKAVTNEVLSEIGCAGIPIIPVYNKCDLLPQVTPSHDGAVFISAKEKTGFDELLDAIAKALPETARRMKLMLPFSEAGLLAKIREEGTVFSEEYTADGIAVDALVDIKLCSRAQAYRQKD